MPIILGLSEEKQTVSARPLAAEYQRSYYHERKRLGVCVKCGRKVEAGMSQCDVCGRIENKRWYSVPCSVMNVSVQSSLQRGLVEGFTSCALRNGKPEGPPVNTGWLHWPTRGDTKRWASAYYVPKRYSKREFVESTTEWRRRDIIELRVEYMWVN